MANPCNQILFREKRMSVKQGLRDRAPGRRGAALHPQAERRPLRHQDREHPDLRGGARGQAQQDGRQAARLRPRALAHRPAARRPRCRARRTTSRPSASAASRRRRRAMSTASASCSTSCSPARCRGTARCRRSSPATSTSSRGRRRSSSTAASIRALETLSCTRSRSGRPSATRTWPRSSTSCKTVMDMLGIGRSARSGGPGAAASSSSSSSENRARRAGAHRVRCVPAAARAADADRA